MKDEKIDLLKLKNEIFEKSIENLKEKLEEKNLKIRKLQDKMIRIVELLKESNNSMLNERNSGSFISENKMENFESFNRKNHNFEDFDIKDIGDLNNSSSFYDKKGGIYHNRDDRNSFEGLKGSQSYKDIFKNLRYSVGRGEIPKNEHFQKKSKIEKNVENAIFQDFTKKNYESFDDKKSIVSSHYKYNKYGLLERNSGSNSTIYSNRKEPASKTQKNGKIDNFPEMTNTLKKIIRSRIQLKNSKESEEKRSIYENFRENNDEKNFTFGLKKSKKEAVYDPLKFENSYRELLRNYDKYTLMKILDKFKGVHSHL